jgi:flagellar protein FliJ
MKRFRFNLRPVSVIRTHHEMRARDAFATAVHLYVEAEERLARVRARKAEFEAALFAGRRDRFHAASEAQSLAAYRRECIEEIEGERAMISARALMGQRRSEYIEAHRRLEVVNRLEAKARAAHRSVANREEQAEFDDFAGRAAHRAHLSAV